MKDLPVHQGTFIQQLWLSMKDLYVWSESHNLAPRFIGPVLISKVVNPIAVKLNLPRSMRIHSTCHISWVKPVVRSSLLLATPTSLPTCILDGEPVYMVKKLLTVWWPGHGHNIWWTGRATVQRRGVGFPPDPYVLHSNHWTDSWLCPLAWIPMAP